MGKSAQSGATPASPLLKRALTHAWAPALLIIASAAAGFALIAREYFSPSDYVGWRQALAFGAPLALIGAGALWEIALGRRAVAEAMKFWSVAALVALMTLAMYVFKIENRAFYALVAPLTCAGFIINHYLPQTLRKGVFALLALVGIVCVFSAAGAIAVAALIALALLLIGVSHLPIAMWMRVAMLAIIGVGLGALRLGAGELAWASLVVPIVASIFMFRLAVYLYDISNGKAPKDIWGRLGYFFMLPNIVFPFFPVVDFATFTRTYYNEDAIKIYMRGVTYTFRGLIHLLLYRFVYMYLVLAPDRVHDAASFVQYIVANFGLYLKISGLFHLVIGLLVLFGFNLPETHSRFYFSRSFIDFWRRINIYWKDFMQKMVFNPSYMRFKKLGVSHQTSVVLAILVVFVGTWALHAYQWFWLRGTLLFTPTDTLFWAILGGLLIIQTLLEARPKPAKSTPYAFLGERALAVIRTISTFTVICLLWSFWTSETVADWLAVVGRSGLAPAMWANSGQPPGALAWAQTALTLAAALLMTAIAMGFTFGLAKAAPPRTRVRPPTPKPSAFYSSAAACGIALVGMATVHLLALDARFGNHARMFALTIGAPQLNRTDQAALTRGYYEDLAGQGNNLDRRNPQLTDLFSDVPGAAQTDIPDRRDPGVHYRDDYLWREFEPNAVAQFQGYPTTYPTNRWGMADRDFPQEKPPGTYRIAVLGASRTQGWRVERSQRFDTLLEAQLNARPPAANAPRYETLNFAFTSYSPVQRLMAFEQKALGFDPDAVIYIAGLVETWTGHQGHMLRESVAMPYPFLDDINLRAGVVGSMAQPELEARLAPYAGEVLLNTYRRIVELARARGMAAVWVYLPDQADTPADIQIAERAARRAGFVIVQLRGEFDPVAHRISEEDGHPNPAGHQRIADLVYQHLVQLQNQGQIDMGLTASEQPTR